MTDEFPGKQANQEGVGKPMNELTGISINLAIYIFNDFKWVAFIICGAIRIKWIIITLNSISVCNEIIIRIEGLLNTSESVMYHSAQHIMTIWPYELFRNGLIAVLASLAFYQVPFATISLPPGNSFKVISCQVTISASQVIGLINYRNDCHGSPEYI